MRLETTEADNVILFSGDISSGKFRVIVNVNISQSHEACLMEIHCVGCDVAQDCEEKQKEMTLFDNLDVDRYGTLLRYTCPPAYEFVDGTTFQDIQCQWDTTWSGNLELKECVGES